MMVVNTQRLPVRPDGTMFKIKFTTDQYGALAFARNM